MNKLFFMALCCISCTALSMTQEENVIDIISWIKKEDDSPTSSWEVGQSLMKLIAKDEENECMEKLETQKQDIPTSWINSVQLWSLDLVSNNKTKDVVKKVVDAVIPNTYKKFDTILELIRN